MRVWDAEAVVVVSYVRKGSLARLCVVPIPEALMQEIKRERVRAREREREGRREGPKKGGGTL